MGAAARTWSRKYYDANPALDRVVPYGTAPWTTPLPMAGFGIVWIGIGILLLLPPRLSMVGVVVLVLGGLGAIVSFGWQPMWADPPTRDATDRGRLVAPCRCLPEILGAVLMASYRGGRWSESTAGPPLHDISTRECDRDTQIGPRYRTASASPHAVLWSRLPPQHSERPRRGPTARVPRLARCTPR
jgi:hypothetical protein